MLATMILTMCAALGQAEAAPANDLAAIAQALAQELGAVEKSKRDEAEKKLLELGPAAIDAIPEINERMPAEMAMRIRRVRVQLEKAAAEASVQASTVSLAGQQMPLTEALAAIQKQTGNKLIDFRPQFGEEPRDVKLSVNFAKLPFWQALDQTLDQAKLTIYAFAGEEGLAMVSRSPTQLPRHGRAAYSGAFRIEGTDFTAHRDLRDPQSHTLQLNVEAAWEPRLRPIVIALSPEAVTATDDQGRPVAIIGEGEAIEINVNPGATTVELPLSLSLPERSVKKLASLKGQLAVLLPGRVEEFRFTDVAKAKRVEQRRGAVTVTLDNVWKNNDLWEFRVRVTFDQAAGALESHRTWVFNNEAWLEGPEKEKIVAAGMETTRQTENEVGVAYLFSGPATLAGHTFVYRTPAAVLSMPVPFELKDLELP